MEMPSINTEGLEENLGSKELKPDKEAVYFELQTITKKLTDLAVEQKILEGKLNTLLENEKQRKMFAVVKAIFIFFFLFLLPILFMKSFLNSFLGNMGLPKDADLSSGVRALQQGTSVNPDTIRQIDALLGK